MTNEQCAVDVLGNLKDASEIEWFNDPDDTEALPRTASTSASTTAIASPESEPIAPAREGWSFL